MKTRLNVACVCVMWLAASTLSAGDAAEASNVGTTASMATVTAAVATGGQGPIEPWIHPSMPKKVSATLEAGFALALERVSEIESCADLFSELGAEAVDMLSSGLYFPVDSYQREVEVCGRNAAVNSGGAKNLAYTNVGGAPTWVCRHFGRVSTETAAVAVIHEALHHAGLTEWPHDRLAMTSPEITEMVESACGF